MKVKSLATGALAACLLGATSSLAVVIQPAQAAVITSLPQGVKQEFTLHSGHVRGPVEFGDGITYRATTRAGQQANSYFGYTGGFTFPDGSNWGGGEPFAAIGLATAVMSFTFDEPVSAVLADFIWARSSDTEFKFRAYDASGALLEDVSFVTNDPAYPKGFYGIERATNQIARFEVEGYYFGLRNFSTSVAAPSAVPEPATWAMMIIGLGTAGAMIRRRQTALAA